MMHCVFFVMGSRGRSKSFLEKSDMMHCVCMGDRSQVLLLPGPDKVRQDETGEFFFQSCRSIHPRGLKIQIDSSGNFLTGEGQNRPVAKDDVIQCLVCDWNTRIDSNPDTVHSRETRVKSCMSRY